jgi:uncharacterized protein (UPF0332 family)
MKAEDRDYAEHRMARAWQSIDEAEYLLQGGYTVLVVNRIYYACFYAVSALLLSEGLSSSKHSGIMTFFDKQWMKTGRAPASMGKFYHVIFEQRQTGDYEDLPAFERDDIVNWLAEARSFVAWIKTWLNENEGLDC